MKATLAPWLYWAPRLLAVVLAVLVSLFALDVLDQEQGVWATTEALLIHLIPTWLLLCALAIAWRWERLGALIFIGTGLVLALGADADWTVFAFLASPSLLIGVLFLIDQHYRARHRPGT
jgi:hypothetical protein